MTLHQDQTENQSRPKSPRGRAALELAEGARSLKAIAEEHGFKMVSYLLDLVALEALDCSRSISTAERAAGGRLKSDR